MNLHRGMHLPYTLVYCCGRIAYTGNDGGIAVLFLYRSLDLLLICDTTKLGHISTCTYMPPHIRHNYLTAQTLTAAALQLH